MHRDLRVGGHEIRNHFAHAGMQQRHRASHAHQAAGFGAGALDHVLGGLRLDQHRLAVRVVGLAQFSHGKAARRALDQAHAQPFFQHGHAPAQLGLGDAEHAPRRRKALVVDYLREVIQVVEVWMQRRLLSSCQ
ncbi:hypothetical protein D9M72_518680 [compost metagenome]